MHFIAMDAFWHDTLLICLLNIAATFRKDSEQSEAIYPLYDTIPYSDSAQVRTKGGPTHEVAQAYEKGQTCNLKRIHIYEGIHEDVRLTEQPSSSMEGTTINPMSGSIKNHTVQVSENDNKQ